jgi:hypothetical protein
MAKLSGVKTLDMVNGEITKIEYNGEMYAKVDGKAQAGDLAISNYSHPDITRGAFYAVVEDRDFFFDTLIDDAGDGHSNALTSSTAFRKVTATDEKYRLVTDRKPKAGDFAKLLATDEDDLTVGNYYEILGIDSDGDFRVNDDDGYETYIMESEGDKFEVYVKGTKYKPAETLKVGDYAKVVDATRYHRFYDGDIVKIVGEGMSTESVSCERLHDGKQQYVPKEELVRATDEEGAEAKAQARWTAIGRNLNEFKKGDIVRVLEDRPCGANLVEGEIGEITVYNDNDSFNVTDKSRCFVSSYQVELITPVEHRFDQ